MSLHIDTKFIRLISSRLRNFKQKGQNLFNFSCPMCGDSRKNRTKARGYVFAKNNDLFYKCHNCGAGTTLGNLIKEVDGSIHKEYILERYKSGEQGLGSNYKAPAFNIASPRFEKLSDNVHYENAERCDRLPENHFCIQYLNHRKFPKQYFNKLYYTDNYKLFCDEINKNHGKSITADKRLVIPFYDEYNSLIAVSGRALENAEEKLRYVTIRTDDSEDKLIFGRDRLKITENIFIVEGPLDSFFLNNAIASGDSNLTLVAKSVGSNNVTLIYDNEPRNKEIVKMMQSAIKSNYKVVIWPNTIQQKDINEMIMFGMSKEEIQSTINKNTFSGLEAQAKLTFWKKI